MVNVLVLLLVASVYFVIILFSQILLLRIQSFHQPFSRYTITPDPILSSTLLQVYSYSGYNPSFIPSSGILLLRIQSFHQPFSRDTLTPDTISPSTLLHVYSYSGYNLSFIPSPGIRLLRIQSFLHPFFRYTHTLDTILHPFYRYTLTPLLSQVQLGSILCRALN